MDGRVAFVADHGWRRRYCACVYEEAMTPRLREKLTPTERTKFFALSRACASASQLTRITARLRMNKFVIEHGEEACQAAWDKRKKKK